MKRSISLLLAMLCVAACTKVKAVGEKTVRQQSEQQLFELHVTGPEAVSGKATVGKELTIPIEILIKAASGTSFNLLASSSDPGLCYANDDFPTTGTVAESDFAKVSGTFQYGASAGCQFEITAMANVSAGGQVTNDKARIVFSLAPQ